MKVVTFTYTMEFDDDVPDEKAIAILIEAMANDTQWEDDKFTVYTVDDE